MSKKKLKGIEVPKTYEDLVKLYGGEENIPTTLKSSLGILQYDIPEGKEIIKREGKDVLVDKDRPENFARFVAGLRDVMSGFTTDYDKLGGQYVDDGTGKEVYKPLGTLKEFDKTDLSNIKLSQSQ